MGKKGKKGKGRKGKGRSRGGKNKHADCAAAVEDAWRDERGGHHGGGGDGGDAAALKARGNKAYQRKDWNTAIACFSNAIKIDGTNHAYYSNRSAAHLAKGSADDALADAEACIALQPAWAKGYLRQGNALAALYRLGDANDAYSKGIKTDPANTTLKKALQALEASKQADALGGARLPRPWSSKPGVKPATISLRPIPRLFPNHGGQYRFVRENLIDRC